MNWKEFYNRSLETITFSDGSMGVLLQKYGLSGGECPESWNITHSEIVESIHRNYIEAGSDLIITNTLGGNRIKLSEYKLENRLKEINRAAVAIAKKAAGNMAVVAGDVGPTGRFVKPLGEISFGDMKAIYKEQIETLADAGADCIFFETHIDILELKAAIIACREVCDLPVIASVTFEENGRTVTGSSAGAAVTMLEALGVEMVGTNCGTGPEDMLRIIMEMATLISIPVIAQANAGVPFLRKGRTVYKSTPESYTSTALKMIECGVNAIGGCCGTTPDYIKFLHEKVLEIKPYTKRKKPSVDFMKLSSRYSVRKIGFDLPFTLIGERLNPTSRKRLSNDIKEGRFELFREEALAQENSGADILDLNMGIEGISEALFFEKGIEILGNLVKTPISIDTADPAAASLAMEIYPGKPLLNSISAEERRLDLLKFVKKYGSAFIALPVDEHGIPKKAAERLALMRKIVDKASLAGIDKKNILADPLVLTVSAEQEGAVETLKTIRLFREEMGLFTTLGLSNVSFGLPARPIINRNFLSMAIANGLTTAIANPFDSELIGLIRASDVLLSRDKNAGAYIAAFSDYEKERPAVSEEQKVNEYNLTIGGKLYQAVLKGNKDNISALISDALGESNGPDDILNNFLLPAINEAGNLYEKKMYFLPQLMLSSETMKKAFSILEPLLKNNRADAKGKVVFATVQGDVHDIGKNIVILLMKNYGFEVLDLGKDVPNDIILERAIENNADIIALSSLMTTTMLRMKEFMNLMSKKGRKFNVLIGGAAVTREFAVSIGASYSVNAVEAVKTAVKLVGDGGRRRNNER